MSLFTMSEIAKKNISVKKALKYEMASEAVFNSLKTDYFDIFLSHSYKDSIEIEKLKSILEEDFGYSVYIDWIEDNQLDREKVNKTTAETLRKRMIKCKCLFFATSQNSSSSKWMPWELGYFDGIKANKVAILPVTEKTSVKYLGQEYLGLYPYITKNKPKGKEKEILWINDPDNVKKYVSFEKWLKNGSQPIIHQ